MTQRTRISVKFLVLHILFVIKPKVHTELPAGSVFILIEFSGMLANKEPSAPQIIVFYVLVQFPDQTIQPSLMNLALRTAYPVVTAIHIIPPLQILLLSCLD